MTKKKELKITWDHYAADGDYHLHVGWDDDKHHWLGIITKFNREDKVLLLCSIDKHETKVEAEKWFRRQLKTKSRDEKDTVDKGSIKIGFA